MTGNEPFARRVLTLHESWVERRQVKALASAHDLDSQLELMLTLHGWARQAADDIRAVYGGTLNVVLSPAPEHPPGDPAFSLSLGDAHTVTFRLAERRRAEGSRWFVSVTVTGAGPGGDPVAAGPERRNGQWSRGRLEDVLLSVLGAFERSTTGGEHATPERASHFGA